MSLADTILALPGPATAHGANSNKAQDDIGSDIVVTAQHKQEDVTNSSSAGRSPLQIRVVGHS
jgi:hypothetical protein